MHVSETKRHVNCDRCGSRRGVLRPDRHQYLCEWCAMELEFEEAIPPSDPLPALSESNSASPDREVVTTAGSDYGSRPTQR